MMIKNISLLLLGFCLVANAFAKPGIPKSEVPASQYMLDIKRAIEPYAANFAFEGTILVARSGDVIFEQSYGLADRSTSQTIDNNSSFQIASLSKPITATLVLKLVELGELKLDDSLAEYLPDFDTKVGRTITLHHLLSHTSGLPDHFAIDGWFSADFHRQTSAKLFAKLVARQALLFEPGASYHYSNLGYFLLGQIVESKTGKSFSDNLNKYLLTPLVMSQSGVAHGFELSKGTVKGYQWKASGGYEEQVAKNMTLFGAGAAIYSTAADLYKFDKALYSDVLLSTESKAQLFSPEHPYSWRVGQVPINSNLTVKAHAYDGKFDGYSSMVMRFIDDKHSVILLSNNGMSYSLKQQLSLDIAAVLYNQDLPDRKFDASLMIIKGVVIGRFSEAMNELKRNTEELSYSERSLSSLAYELLWSGLGDNALMLFSFIADSYPDSKTAAKQLDQACGHRLTQAATNRKSHCS